MACHQEEMSVVECIQPCFSWNTACSPGPLNSELEVVAVWMNQLHNGRSLPLPALGKYTSSYNPVRCGTSVNVTPTLLARGRQ